MVRGAHKPPREKYLINHCANILEEVGFYTVLLGPVHILIGIAISVLLMRKLRKGRDAYRRTVGKSWLFLCCVFLSGIIYHILWSNLVFTNLYCNWDYVIDFTPFWPPSRENVTMVCDWHSHDVRYPVAYSTTFAVWVAFATASWITTIAMYLTGLKMLRKRNRTGV